MDRLSIQTLRLILKSIIGLTDFERSSNVDSQLNPVKAEYFSVHRFVREALFGYFHLTAGVHPDFRRFAG
jgi:hypothetical protein